MDPEEADEGGAAAQSPAPEGSEGGGDGGAVAAGGGEGGGGRAEQRVRPTSVIVKLKGAANAPMLVEKKRKFKIPAAQPLTRVTQHVEQLLKEKLMDGARIFLYVSSAKSNFSPSPDQTVGNLFMCFGRESGKGSAILELTYTVTPSWG